MMYNVYTVPCAYICILGGDRFRDIIEVINVCNLNENCILIHIRQVLELTRVRTHLPVDLRENIFLTCIQISFQ